MGAGEHQGEALVGNLARFPGHGFELLGQQLQMIDGGRADLPSPRRVDYLATRHRQQPGFRTFGHAGGGPVDQRGGESLRQGVLGAGHVAGARAEVSDQLAIAAARGGLGRCARVGSAASRRQRIESHICRIGRTSIAPNCAPGHREAQDSAPSRSGVSIR
jgi:hypothetical protein